MDEPSSPTTADIDAVLQEFDGDVRAAIGALLHDLAVLAADFMATVSHGYVRGRPTSEGSARVPDRWAGGE